MTPRPTDADRRAPLSDLCAEPFDVLIVGGGIVGAGVARDAAMRGLRVLLVDRYDFAFGTSSRSTRLLHGGLRYLSQGRIRLVREASREKRIVDRIAPHLCRPLAFVFPAYRGSDLPRWKLYAGVKLYDLLCGGRNLGRSRALSPRATIDRLPGLSEKGLTGSVRYFDGLTNDARLVIDTLRSAANHGATLLNYVHFVEAARDGSVWNCSLERQPAGQRVEVRARTVVNATGPWSDSLSRGRVRLRPTKGVHLVLDRSRLPIADAMSLTQGRRFLLAIPWGERVFVGSTDTDYAGPTEAPTCDAADVRYVLDVVNDHFPALGLGAADVVAAWAGIRPLVDDPDGDPSDISREHEIAMPEPGWFDIFGGKLTTYRLMGEQAVDRIVGLLGRKCPACRTALEPLLPPAESAECGILPPPVGERAVRDACRNQWAVHLDDVMIRRTSWRYYHADHPAIAERAVAWMAESLGWDARQAAAELERYERMCGPNAESGAYVAPDE